MALSISLEDLETRNAILTRVLGYIRDNIRIKLPPFDPQIDRPSDLFALQSVGLEPNDFGGHCGEFRFQFEGEEDLLHLLVFRLDGEEIEVSDAQRVAGFLLPGVAPALIWLKPGTYGHHFYVGHDELTASLDLGLGDRAE